LEKYFIARKKKYFFDIINFVKHERLHKKIYPPSKDIFNAFLFTPFSSIKVVILGQDPYFSPNQANGLAFSVPQNCSIPPSLRNIYKEINSNFHKNHVFFHGNLYKWAQQGVFLLNTTLTVESGKPGSHCHIGWHIFTDSVISKISLYKKNVIFLLWGAHAKKKCNLINSKDHYILQTSHPSPLSAHRGFLGCKHFLHTNKILLSNNNTPVNWFF